MNFLRMVFMALLGLLTPIRISGRLYLEDRLQRDGIDVRLPRACLQELADEAIDNAKAVAQLRRQNWRKIITEYLDAQAYAIGSVLTGDRRGRLLPPELVINDRIKEVLRKHGVTI
jgi:hypothetical protein